MRPPLSDIANQKFDVIVVGGGINGAGIAREAQLAGYKTLLVEREDFGSGTTSRATRLIHGGLRYLEHGELGLVSESLREREDLVRSAPHLVKPLRLLLPVYNGDARPAWKVRAGLTLYDLLSMRKSLPRNRSVPKRDLDRIAPGIAREGLEAAYMMSDAQVEFPERLVIEAIRDLTDAGGTALNHVAAVGIVSPAHKLKALRVRDEPHNGAQAPPPATAEGHVAQPPPAVHSPLNAAAPTFEIETKVIINAAGPWADQVLAGTDAERHERLIGGTKGSHLVVDWPGAPKQAIFASAKSDRRPFFILPWYGMTLIGTTDIRYDSDPSDALCTPEELQYLLDEATRLFPDTPLRREHVHYTYSGVRPLPYTPAATEDESSISRSHFVIDHAKRGGPNGLLSIVGGKLTTYRSLARITLPAIKKHCQPSGTAAPTKTGSQPPPAVHAPTSDPLAIYGPRRQEVDAMIAADPTLAEQICPHNPETLAQVAYAVEREQALTLADVLLRRLAVGWSPCHTLDGAARAARVIAVRLGWDDSTIGIEILRYHADLRTTVRPMARQTGDRIRVSKAYHWAMGAFGKVADFPPRSETAARYGSIWSSFVYFDVPQMDPDGDGPYTGGAIDELFLESERSEVINPND